MNNNIKTKIIKLLEEIEKGKYSNIILNKFFNECKLEYKEKAYITEAFYGVIRNKLLLEEILNILCKEIKKDWQKHLLMISLYQLIFMKSDEKGVVWEASELTKQKYSFPVSRFVNGVLRNFLRQKENLLLKIKNEKENIYYSVPQNIYQKILNEFQKNSKFVIEKLKSVPIMCYRVNTLKYSNKEFRQYLLQHNLKIEKEFNEIFYINSGILLQSELFKTGKITVQDGASFLAAYNLAPESHEKVLDMCGAPGGKTCVLATQMKNKGEILSCDIYPHKIKLIKENCNKLGITNVNTALIDSRKLILQGQKFDKILVDAPCSGFGVISKKPENIYTKDNKNFVELAKLQFELLDTAINLLNENGKIVYSTCTIFVEENTEIIKKILNKYHNLKIEKLYIPENVKGHYDELGGFYIDYNEKMLDSFYIIKLGKMEI